ncbi:UNVERIFIED_CONTAM: T/G mismatch-specific endonuclease [Williamsia faeni]
MRQLLHAQGFRYRVDVQPERALRRRADIVFARDKLAVFIDGCFWHSCPLHATSPKANAEWWREKLDANIARDRDTDRRLEEAGWTVLRFWEHDDPAAVARSIASTMGRA